MSRYSEREIHIHNLLIKILLIIAIVLTFLMTLSSSVWWIKFFFGGVSACLFWLQISHKNIRMHLSGIRGENKILNLLNRLPKDYRIIPGIEQKNVGDIDFVVVGPKGIATIEVKNHWGGFSYHDGKLNRKVMPVKKDFVKQAKSEALAIHDLIQEKTGHDIYVQPIIVFSNTKAVIREGMKPLRGTNVIAIRFDWIVNVVLGQKGPLLGQNAIEKIVSVLRQEKTRNSITPETNKPKESTG